MTNPDARAADVPVLILAWRRPELTAQVIDAVGAWRPKRLFLACDGWDEDAPPDLIDRIRATRSVLDRAPDWECDVRRRYADENRGVRDGVADALDWFFGECEEGIILEDDCLPSPEFGPYCAELLARYRDEPRVMCISGDGSSGVAPTGAGSYAFVRYPLIWGWASWRRAWANYDRDLEEAASLGEDAWERILPDGAERRVWQERLVALRGPGQPNTWDMVWALSLLRLRGLSVHPRVNLIRNTGFGPDATHTQSSDQRGSIGTAPILPLVHPVTVSEDEAASRRIFDLALGGAEERQRFAWERSAQGRLRLWLHRVVVPRLPWPIVRLGRLTVGARPWMRAGRSAEHR